MHYLMKNMNIDERPRERLELYGSYSLSNEELLAIIIKTGTRDKSSKVLAMEVLNLVDNIHDLKDITINKLLSIKGIGKVKAIEILAVIELSKRINTTSVKTKIKLNSPDQIYISNKDIFTDKKQEYFYCIYLNNKNELIERKLLFMGTVNRSIVHPREVFKNAYLLSASSIVCMHNHPSGDITPSKDDIIFTKALVEVGHIQNIPVLDHIIFGEDNYYSFSNNGLI